MKNILILLLSFALTSCAQKTNFDTQALNETFTTVNNTEIAFKDLLKKHLGKTIFIDIWASWCSDCVASLPDFKKLQKNNTNVDYIMLSVDKTANAWKEGIKKYDLNAEHYLISKGWKASDFCKSIDLDWIPRYMIVGKDGTIKMYNAIKFSDKKIAKTIKEDK